MASIRKAVLDFPFSTPGARGCRAGHDSRLRRQRPRTSRRLRFECLEDRVLLSFVAKPNLTPYRPAGWSGKIVVSSVAGTNTDASSLTTNDTVYIDWAVLNNGNAATSARFTSGLYVDGKLRQSWSTDPPLNSGDYAYVTDYALGQLGAGQHTIQIRVDTGKTVAETDENDNAYTKTITVGSTQGFIRLVANYLDGAREGFNDPSLGAQRRAAFEYALGIWSGLLPSAYAGETITVDARFDPLGGGPNDAILGQAGPKQLRWNFGGNSLANTLYGDALANHLKGGDLGPGSAEIAATFNSDVDNSYVLGSIDWYYGTDGNCGENSDFASVVLHELGHGLDFSSAFDPSSGRYYGSYPDIYDRFLEIGDGTDLTGMSNAGRAAAAVSNDLYWSGSGGIAGNGGTRPKLYAPRPVEPGSSVSHTDETLYPNDLMSPWYSGPDHDPGSMDLGMLADLGWNLRSGSSSASPLARPFDASAGPGESAPFGRWIEDRYVLPQTPASRYSLGLAPPWLTSDFAAAIAAYGDRLGALDRPSSPLGRDASGGQSSLGSPWEPVAMDDTTGGRHEGDSAAATLAPVAVATTLQLSETPSLHRSSVDEVFATESPAYLPSDLDPGLSDLGASLRSAGSAERSAGPCLASRPW